MISIPKEQFTKHPLVELFDRIENNWIEHEGSHKITIDGITIESSDKYRKISKTIKLSGNFKVDISKK